MASRMYRTLRNGNRVRALFQESPEGYRLQLSSHTMMMVLAMRESMNRLCFKPWRLSRTAVSTCLLGGNVAGCPAGHGVALTKHQQSLQACFQMGALRMRATLKLT